MKKIVISLSLFFAAGFTALPAGASDLMIAAAMQACNTNEECTLITNSCADNCGFVPVNKANTAALDASYQARCGKAMSANPVCNMNPPIAAACVNSRCTIDYAYVHHAGAADYKAGAYPVPEQPVASKVKGDYSRVNDRHGFTAYDLPQAEIKQNNVGTLTTKVYVPPAAPVNGGNYVPVTPPPSATAATAPVATAPEAAIAPSAAPAPAPVAAQQQQPAPAAAAPAATPSTYVPQQPQLPTAPAKAVPAVGAPGVPVAPPGSVPIPPSDLQPQPTFVPPVGSTVPVGPDDPGATPEGVISVTPVPSAPAPVPAESGADKAAGKTFGGIPPKTSKYTGTNQ